MYFLSCLLLVVGILASCHRLGDPNVEQLVKPDQEKALSVAVPHTERPLLERLVVLGDSLSDIGRLNRRSAGLYIPPDVYWHGRLTNGPNWTDYACAALGCRLQNYAVAGAATRLESVPLRWIVRPLDAQVEEFLGETPAADLKESVVVIWIGANNYLHTKTPHADETKADIKASAAILLKAGVKRLLIGTMPQLAGLLETPGKPSLYTPEAYRQITALHNQNMRALVPELQQEFPDQTIALFDAYEINQATIDHPADYRFTRLTEACYQGTYRGEFHGARAFCQDYLGWKFWDYTHPNSRMHCYYGARFLMSLHEAGWLETLDAEKAIDSCRQL